jgi:AraC-like DNA-binding protein
MDLLSRALASLHFKGHALGIFKLHGPWGFDIGELLPGYYYGVLQGACWIRRENGDALQLHAGDSLLAPRGGAAQLTSHPDAPRVPIEQAWAAHDLPRYRPNTASASPLHFTYHAPDAALERSDEPGAHLLAIAFAFEDDVQQVLDGLPRQILLRATDAAAGPWMRPAIDFITHEDAQVKGGFAALGARLVDLILVSMIRSYAVTDKAPPPGWLRGLQDARIGASLEAMHRAPTLTWTLESLAAAASMSRSAFASRFAKLVGRTPIEYLTFLKMHAARRLLDGTALAISEVSERVGYGSDRAFRRAFSRQFGVFARTGPWFEPAPAKVWRRQNRTRRGGYACALALPRRMPVRSSRNWFTSTFGRAEFQAIAIVTTWMFS